MPALRVSCEKVIVPAGSWVLSCLFALASFKRESITTGSILCIIFLQGARKQIDNVVGVSVGFCRIKQNPQLSFIGGCPLLVGIQSTFGGNTPPNNGTGLSILGQH